MIVIRQHTFDEQKLCWNIEEPDQLFCLGDIDFDYAETYAHPSASQECWWFSSN